MKNGKTIYVRPIIEYDAYKTVADTLISEEKYKTQYEEMIKFEDIAIIYDGKMLNKEATRKIRDVLNNTNLQALMNSKQEADLYREGFSYARGSGNPSIRFYQYKNHEFRTYYLDKTLTPEIFNVVTTELNKKAYEELVSEETNLNLISVYVSEHVVSGEIQEKPYEYFSNHKEIVNYIKEHVKDVCDINKSYYVFYCYSTMSSENMCVFLNSTEELENLIEKYKIIETEEAEGKYLDDVVYQ